MLDDINNKNVTIKIEGILKLNCLGTKIMSMIISKIAKTKNTGIGKSPLPKSKLTRPNNECLRMLNRSESWGKTTKLALKSSVPPLVSLPPMTIENVE